MRTKIIAVHAIIVVLVGLLAFVLVRTALVSASSNTSQIQADAKHQVQSSSARLQLDALRTERWLAGKAGEPATLEVMAKSSPAARGEAATALCDAVLSAAKQSVFFPAGGSPSLVILLDAQGKVLGRNGSTLGRGEDMTGYAGLKAALTSGNSGSDVWVNTEKNDQYMASYAPVRNEQGRIVGAIAAGFTLNDELSRVSEATTGRPLRLVMLQADNLQVVGNSGGADSVAAAISGGAKDSVKASLTQGHIASTQVDDMVVASSPVEGFGDGKRAAVVVGRPASLIDNVGGMLLPLIGGVTVLGLVLVIAAGILLGNYITRPITELEEGLLAILNGQTDKRFQLDHPDLGGLAFRIDQLLNQLMGVEEDNTDEEGRVSKAPSANNFGDAMSVDDKRMHGETEGMDSASLQQLAAEPLDAYYARIYREYIGAKKALGEATDHITDAAFKQRINGMEQEASAKYGKPVRYRVQTRGREVVLLAIPIG